MKCVYNGKPIHPANTICSTRVYYILLTRRQSTWFCKRLYGFLTCDQLVLTFPLTDWIGSTTTATALSDSASKLCWVLISTPESQQPNPGWEWYHPTTISGLPVCFSISNILVWNTGSTASTLTPCDENQNSKKNSVQYTIASSHEVKSQIKIQQLPT